jgi:hypothetical protein
VQQHSFSNCRVTLCYPYNQDSPHDFGTVAEISKEYAWELSAMQEIPEPRARSAARTPLPLPHPALLTIPIMSPFRPLHSTFRVTASERERRLLKSIYSNILHRLAHKARCTCKRARLHEIKKGHERATKSSDLPDGLSAGWLIPNYVQPKII